MIKTLLTSFAACTIAVPPIATAESNAPGATRESVRFTAAAANWANHSHEPYNLRAEERGATQESEVPMSLSRGSGQRAHQRSLQKSPTTANSTNTLSFEATAKSTRFTANAVIRAKHANEPNDSVVLYRTPKPGFGEGNDSKRGSGHRALVRSLKNPSANTGEPSLGAARESVRYTANAEIRANYTVALFPRLAELPESSDNSKRGSGQRAHLRSLRNNAELD